jgi:hypothetical protein
VGKTIGKGPPVRTKRKWDYNIKVDLREMIYGGVDWTDLAEDRDQCWGPVNNVINIRFP